ncbi:MAG: hypothetical protein DRJ41_00200 [Thermoprotei archaeon]|nr:MAG: hypothetical protein DRJ41_00200 [Thermoprotei archaeon]
MPMISAITIDKREVALISLMAGLALVTNYALISVPNVKLMDLIVFAVGFSLGPVKGALMGVLIWVVYGTLNPYGFSLPIWLSTMVGESIYGVVGGLRGKRGFRLGGRREYLLRSLEMAFWAFLTTLIYDLLTNVVFALTFGIPVIQALLAGTPFMMLHQAGNIVSFFTLAIPVIQAINKALSLGPRNLR